MNIYYQINTYDKKEKLKEKFPRVQARSFVKQFLQSLYTNMSDLAYTKKDINNVNTAGSYALHCVHPGGESFSNTATIDKGADKFGLVVGTGSGAVTVDDYCLATQIAHGTSAGQFYYYGTWIYNIDYSVSGVDGGTFDIERIFYNNSGGSITVNEIGIYEAGGTNVGNCAIRDVLDSGVAVADAEYLKVKYIIQVSL